MYVIEFSDGVKWVARITGKGTEFEELDIKKMDTDYQTMRFTKAFTSILLQTVFTWKASEGVAGAPFALMSFVEGLSTIESLVRQVLDYGGEAP